jgi:hypothetical protein
MFVSWLYGTTIPKVSGVDDVCVKLDPSFVKFGLECGVRVLQPDAQSIIMISDDEFKSAFSIRVCPVWDLNTQSITTYVLRTKQMYHPFARDPGVFISWLKRFGLKCEILSDKMDISTLPIASNGVSTVHTWMIAPKKLMNLDIDCWVLHYTSAVITRNQPVDQQCDKKEEI